VSRWVLYILLLLSLLCLFVTGSAEKNKLSLINSMSIETKNPDPGTAVSISIPAIYATNKPSNIFAMGAGKKTVPKTISPEEAKGQSSAGYCMNRNASSRNTSSDDNSIFSSSDLSSDGSYLSGNSINGSGIIENMATADCDQFDPTSSTATVPITILSALSANETSANVGLRRNYNVQKPFDFLTYATIVTSTGKIKLANPVIAGSPITIFTKDGNVPFEVLRPGNSRTPSGKYNATSDNISNNSIINIVSAADAAYDQVNPQSSRVNAYKYRIIQPVSPSRKYNYLNASYLGESSHYVGADGHTITLVNNESAVDPSYKQLVEFIKEDKTNEIPYNNTSFVCSDAAERVHNNAEAIGFRSAWVYIDFTNERATLNPTTNALVVGHACNLFNTTDEGLVAIDCTGGSCPTDEAANVDLSKWDNEVSLVKNGEYTPRLLYSFPGSNKLKDFLSMGTIADYYVFW